MVELSPMVKFCHLPGYEVHPDAHSQPGVSHGVLLDCSMSMYDSIASVRMV